jgi:hypothetical protein
MGSNGRSTLGGKSLAVQPKVVILLCWKGSGSMGPTVRLDASGTLIPLQNNVVFWFLVLDRLRWHEIPWHEIPYHS